MLPFHQLTDFDGATNFRYSDEQVEQLLAELLNILEKQGSDRPFPDGVRQHGH